MVAHTFVRASIHAGVGSQERPKCGLNVRQIGILENEGALLHPVGARKPHTGCRERRGVPNSHEITHQPRKNAPINIWIEFLENSGNQKFSNPEACFPASRTLPLEDRGHRERPLKERRAEIPRTIIESSVDTRAETLFSETTHRVTIAREAP